MTGHAYFGCSLVQKPEDCKIFNLEFSLQVWKHHADITYSLLGHQSPQINNISESRTPVTVEPHGYLRVYDIVYRPIEPVPDMAFTLFGIAAAMFEDPIENLVGLLELFLMPLLHQQYFVSPAPETYVNASFTKESYRVSVSQGSIHIFAAFSVVVLGWCIILLVTSGFRRMPEVASVPEFDLVSKIPLEGDNSGIGEACLRLSKAKLLELGRATNGIEVWTIRPRTPGQGERGDDRAAQIYELEDRL